ncbi:MAG: 4Fe-4S binding protein [Tannerellaceae bacterium]|nr:4Fe-4S binding protein [Tannerellaceae bacterium]
MKFKLSYFIPLLIGLSIAIALRWWGFFIIFPWIGGCITAGIIISSGREGRDRQIGRRLSILMIAPVFLVFIGLMQRENLQLEETVIYALLFLATGIFTRVLIHYAIAKLLGPFIWGRGFCGWACWTAAVLEWLPVKENKPIPERYTYIRYLTFLISLLVPLIFVWLGYDWPTYHVNEKAGGLIAQGKSGQLMWFIVGNSIYYLVAIALAFKFKKKRAFCKIVCPVSIVMKAQTGVALIHRAPTGEKCISCKKCSTNCPMDVDVMKYISAGKRVRSSECISCGLCTDICPQKAIR